MQVRGDRGFPDAVVPNLLLSASDVVERLQVDPDNTRILDARRLRDFRRGHIRSARHAWWQDTMERNADTYGATLKPDDGTGEQTRRLAVLDLWGASLEMDVIVYGDRTSVEAARIVWFLSFLGFPRVALLDGGYAAWLGQGIVRIDRPEGIGDPPASAATAPRNGYYLLYEQVLNRLAEGNTVLLDVRTAAELADTVDGTVRPGTIPGAIVWPWDTVLDGDGLIRPAAELADRARSLGLRRDQRVILVGRFATDCALSWLALRLIGFADVPTYDGGWTEWATEPGASVAWR